jgi:hypothetical protein
MRDAFKFRVWSHENNEFLESYAGHGELFLWNGNWVDVGWFMQCQRCETNRRFTVQQYIGTRDCGGREICEGDLVDFDAVPMNRPYQAQQYRDFIVRYSSPHASFVFGYEEYIFGIGDGVKTETLKISGHMFAKNEF